jgi:hypothetical protein
MNRKISIIGLSLLIFGLIIVPGFTADMNQSDSSKTFGCGSAGPVSDVDLDDWDDDDDCLESGNTAQVYFELGNESTPQKNDKPAWGKMCYTFCGPEFNFVFNGHGFAKDDDTNYLLIYQDPMDFTYHLLGEGSPNNGGNLHIKGKKILENFQEAAVFVAKEEDDLCDPRTEMCDRPSETPALIGTDTISYTADCTSDGGTCDGNVYSAPLSGDAVSGGVIFAVGPSGEEIYYKMAVDNAGTISEAYIRIMETGDIGDQRLVQIYPAEMDLNLPGHDFMALGVINADDRFTTGVLGTTDPVGSLIRAFNAGLTYVNVLGPEETILANGAIEPADCDALRDLWDLHFGDWVCGGGDDEDDVTID